MSRILLVRPEAEAEISEAYEWYKRRSESLREEFLTALQACLDLIELQPLAYSPRHRQVRRALLRKFPYSIFYVYELVAGGDECITVLACFHGRREPKHWLTVAK